MSNLVTTYQLRLPRGDHEETLSRMSSHLGDVERRLHRALEKAHTEAKAEIDAYGGKDAFRKLRNAEGKPLPNPILRLKNQIKVRFLREFGITGRQYNSILRGLEGRHDSLREILSERIKTTERKLSKLEKNIKARTSKIASFAKVSAEVDVRAKLGKGPTDAQKKKLMSRDEYNRARFAQHHQKRRAQSLRDRLVALKREADRDIPAVVFGSKKLLRKRSAIHKNDLEAIARWKNSWDAARSAGFMLMGSKDETAGCQSCIGQMTPQGRLSLKLRLPNSLASGSEKHLLLEDLELPDFGADAIRTALRAHVEKSAARTAITYRFVRDADWPKGRKASAWRVCITIAEQMPDISRRSFETHTTSGNVETTSAIGKKDIFAGAIGVDINADHLAWAVIDRFGNPLKTHCGKIPLPLRGKTSGRRDAIIGRAAGEIIAIALRMGLPIVLEKLDFTAKKKDLEGQSAGYARMLSSFAYAKIQTTLRRRAIRDGVELVDVNPAYTSVIGRVNYAERYGLSVHISAAVSIARRAAQFSERVNYFHGLRRRRNTLNAKNEQRRHVWRQWAQVRKDLSTPGGSRNWLVASNAISFAPRARAHADAASGAIVKRRLEEEDLALKELVSNDTSNPGSSSLGGCE